jgi:hypothetical protein
MAHSSYGRADLAAHSGMAAARRRATTVWTRPAGTSFIDPSARDLSIHPLVNRTRTVHV